ncbi:MAG: hypothetical protein QOJ56_4808 [Mycobacterium sp.]|nr:hypothetical protein [Mycobacterium sp.]
MYYICSIRVYPDRWANTNELSGAPPSLPPEGGVVEGLHRRCYGARFVLAGAVDGDLEGSANLTHTGIGKPTKAADQDCLGAKPRTFSPGLAHPVCCWA